MAKPIRVGIVGLRPDESWAAKAHLPALRSLPHAFELVGVANSSFESSKRAAAACGIPLAFASADELAASDAIDLVSVTVKVPGHAPAVRSALAAGKHVYCEWPLGNGMMEAAELAGLASSSPGRTAIGTQFLFAPELRLLRQLISEGYVGEVLSTSVIGSGLGWGAAVDPSNAYLLDRKNGATLLTIPVGHTLAGLRAALGNFKSLSAAIMNRRTSARILGSEEVQTMSAPDQVMMHGSLASGAAISVHYRGGTPAGTGFLWEINGTDGDLQISGDLGHPQMVRLSLKGSRGQSALEPILPHYPEDFAVPADPVAGNVARLYAAFASEINGSGCGVPNFDDALQLHHLLSDIERSAITESRVTALIGRGGNRSGHDVG